VDPYQAQGLQWLNKAAFDSQTPYNQKVYGTWGSMHCAAPVDLPGTPLFTSDLKVTERNSITIRLEAFNLLNHVVFSNPVASVASRSFGLITSGSSGRAFQLAAKYMF